MDFIGSKTKLLGWIFDTIGHSVPCPAKACFLDACSGSGAVTRQAVRMGYRRVVANDLMGFSAAVVRGSIGGSQRAAAREISRLNSLPGIDGYFYRHFSDESRPPRLFFTAGNARKIDHARAEIDKIANQDLRDYLVYCGVEALSRVSNTTGVHAAFLKKFKSRALDPYTLREEPRTPGLVEAITGDIITLLGDSKFRKRFREDVLYIDPPYNHRQYGPNYHLYETFCRNDNPPCRGVAGLRDWESESSSRFCSKGGCLEFLKSVVAATTASRIFLSYSSDGIMSLDEICSEFGCSSRDVHRFDQRRYRADTDQTRQYSQSDLVEYLFEIRK